MTREQFIDKWANKASREACSCCSSDECVLNFTRVMLSVLTENMNTETIDNMDAYLSVKLH